MTYPDAARGLPRLLRQLRADEVAGGGTIGTADGIGTAQPRELASVMPLLERAFGFVDLCGFTNFIDSHGEHAALGTLQRFRSLTRELSARRGVQVAKWLGDGAMLVASDVAPLIATSVELIARHSDEQLAIRGGLAHGDVLNLDGDDYIGRPVNLAARLCQAANPAELLAIGYPADTLPAWVQVVGTRRVDLRGLGRRNAQKLGLVADVDLPALEHPSEV